MFNIIKPKPADQQFTRKAAAVAYTLLVASYSLPSQAEQSSVDSSDFLDLSLEELMDVKVDCKGKKNA